MENRARLWAGFKEKVAYVGLGLLLTLGLPLLAKLVSTSNPNPRLAFLSTVEQIGWVYLPLAPLLLMLLTWWSWHRIRVHQQDINHKMLNEGVTYLLLPRPDAPPTRAEKVSMWQRISQVLPHGEHLSFELSGGQAGVMFSLRATDEKVCRAFLTKVMTEYPGAEARRVESTESDPVWVDDTQVTVWMELIPTRRDQPLAIATPDPQIAVLGELALLPQGVRAGLQVLVRSDWHTRGRLMSQAARATSKKPDKGSHALRPSNFEKREVAYVDDRSQESFVEARIIVWAAAPVEGMAWGTVYLLADTLRGQYDVHNPLKIGKKGVGSRFTRELSAFSGTAWSVTELGTLAHLVGGETAALAAQLLRARGRPLPATPQTYIPRHAKIAPFLRQARPVRAGADSLAEIEVVIDDEDFEDEVAWLRHDAPLMCR